MTLPMMSSLNEAVALIYSAQRIAVFAHISPDPDAIGSLLGVGHVVTALGKDVALICEDSIPRGLEFLPDVSLVSLSLPDQFLPDLVVGLDASDPTRLGDGFHSFLSGRIPVVNIDHHATNLRYGTVNVVGDHASTAELVIELADALRVELNPELATCLLTGIVGDTRCFSTSSVSNSTMQAAGRCIESGAEISFVAEAVFFRKTLNQLRLWGIALSHLNYSKGLLWSIIPLADRQMTNLGNTPLNGFSSLLLNAEEANIAVVFTELEDHAVELSMRARPGYDVAEVALALGGGGHTLAAGCKAQGELNDIVDMVVGLLQSQTVKQPDGLRSST